MYNTYHYSPIPTNTNQYILYTTIHTNTSNTGQYILIYTNAYQYIPICTIHTIFLYMPILTNTYEYLHTWPLNTYQYLPLHVIHTKNNTCQYMPYIAAIIHTMSIHTKVSCLQPWGIWCPESRQLQAYSPKCAVPARRPRPCIPARPPDAGLSPDARRRSKGPALGTSIARKACQGPKTSLSSESPTPGVSRGPDRRVGGGARLGQPCGAGSRPQVSGITLPPSSFWR